MSASFTTDRRRFLECFAGLGLSSTLFPGVLWAQVQQKQPPTITREILRDASVVAGMTFSEVLMLIANTPELKAAARACDTPLYRLIFCVLNKEPHRIERRGKLFTPVTPCSTPPTSR